MPNREAAARTSRPETVRVPDQLQQTRRPPPAEQDREGDRSKEQPRAPGKAGILAQLDVERGHD